MAGAAVVLLQGVFVFAPLPEISGFSETVVFFSGDYQRGTGEVWGRKIKGRYIC